MPAQLKAAQRWHANTEHVRSQINQQQKTAEICGGRGTHVAGKVRAASVAVVNVAGRGVVESSVEVVARTLSVELTRAVGNVGLSTG